MHFYFIILPIIGALIGWFTNFLAVKMLFHPREPKRFLGMTIQGVFPKRQIQVAEKIGKLVANELLSFDDIKERIIHNQGEMQLEAYIVKRLNDYLNNGIKEDFPMFSMLVGDKMKSKIQEKFTQEIKKAIPLAIEKNLNEIEKNVNIKEIVFKKVAALDTDKLEELLNQVIEKELVFIERIGGVVGFIIGVVQALIVYFTNI